MDKKTQMKVVVCGVALVSLSAIHAAPASGQVLGSGGCDDFISGAATSGGACVQFDPGPQTHRVDFDGNHSFKVIVDVLQQFYLEIEPDIFTPPGPLSLTSRYPVPTGLLAETCIPYVFATGNTTSELGDCALYNVRAFDSSGNELSQEDAADYFSGQIIYRIAWNFPTLASAFDNPRGLRAEDDVSPFFDLTSGVFPTLQSGEDPGVDMQADGFSQYIVVHQPHGNTFAGCAAPLNCSPTGTNVFNAPQTIPIKVFLNPQNPSADLRLTYTDPAGVSHLAEAAGNSNTGNKFRRAGNSMLFTWNTAGLAAGVYQLTISPGTDSGDLFAPKTFLITIQ